MTSCEEAARAMYSASAVERATVCWSLLLQETGPPGIMAMKLARERRSTPNQQKTGVLLDEEVGGDGANEGEARILGAGDVSEDALGLLSMYGAR